MRDLHEFLGKEHCRVTCSMDAEATVFIRNRDSSGRCDGWAASVGALIVGEGDTPEQATLEFLDGLARAAENPTETYAGFDLSRPLGRIGTVVAVAGRVVKGNLNAGMRRNVVLADAHGNIIEWSTQQHRVFGRRYLVRAEVKDVVPMTVAHSRITNRRLV